MLGNPTGGAIAQGAKRGKHDRRGRAANRVPPGAAFLRVDGDESHIKAWRLDSFDRDEGEAPWQQRIA